MKQNKNIKLCLGIDPNPSKRDIESFRKAVYKHMEILDFCKSSLQDHIIKPQLAFFLSFGSDGITLLEELIARFQNQYKIIIDAKFNDISTSLQAYLHFVFRTLGAHGLTISPFLGEKSLRLAFEECGKIVGKKGRIYTLCATSEASKGHLSFIQDNWKQIILACTSIRDEVFQGEPSLQNIAGVVVAANRENILLSDEIKASGLSILSPGLGAQGADWGVITQCENHPNEIIFPVSRAIFSGGNISMEKIQENLSTIQRYF